MDDRWGHEDTVHSLPKMCVTSYLLISFLTLVEWQMAQASIRLVADDTQRPKPIPTPCPLHTPNPFPRRRARQHSSTSTQPVPIRPQAKYTRPQPHHRVGWLGQLGKDVVLRHNFDAKA